LKFLYFFTPFDYIYINNITQASFHTTLFADDINLHMSNSHFNVLQTTVNLELPYFPANKPNRRIIRGQFLALKMSVFPYYRLISRISKFRYLTTGTFFSICNKVCQVCVTFIMHQRMFYITTVKLILLALLIAVAVILFPLLSSFTRQCIFRNGARAEDKVLCLRKQ